MHPRPQGGKRYFYTLDVARAGVNSVLQVEAYMDAEKNEPRVVLPMPVKNMKASSPETFTSPTDVWLNVDVKSPFVVEAAAKADELLQSTVFSASISGRPQLIDVVHAEKRTRDLSLELQYLQKLEADNAADGPAVVASIARKRSELVTKLSAKVRTRFKCRSLTMVQGTRRDSGTSLSGSCLRILLSRHQQPLNSAEPHNKNAIF